MRDWNNLTADVNVIMNKHFSVGRGGAKIDKVVVHHNGGNLSVKGCYDVWQTRRASAHYQVQSDGVIGQLVWDRDTAWHAANNQANRTSIGIEHANSSGPMSPITEATLDNGAHLVAALCKAYNLGRPAWKVNVFPHQHYTSTDCPGHIAGDQNAAYMERAQSWYDQMTGSSPAPTPAPAPAPTPADDIESLARRTIAGEFGNGDERKVNLGDSYTAVQARVNQILGGGGSSAPDIDALARAVIRGDYGNGDERKRRLGSNYSAVQARVNQMLR